MTAADTIGVHIDFELREFLDGRAKAISMSRSKFAAEILKWWKAQGAPPVTPADEAMQRLNELKVAEPPTKYGK